MKKNGVSKVNSVWPAFDSAVEQVPQKQCKYVTSRIHLGDGNFSVVKECMNVQTNVRYAMKLVPKRLVRGRLQLIQREVTILRHISERVHELEEERNESSSSKMESQGTFDGHHHVLQLFDYFETRDNIVLVTQLCEDRDLYDKIISAGSFDIERQVKPYTACLLSALSFLHENGIIHRDIKAENILFRLRDKVAPIDGKYDAGAHDLIMADFGLAVRKTDISSLKEYVGTLSYLAPEVVHCKGIQRVSPQEAAKLKNYSTGVDIWALGVLCYFMMTGYMPFDCENEKETIECIIKSDYYVDEGAQNNSSVSFKQCWGFMQQCFTNDGDKRPSANELMGHIFVREYFQLADARDFSEIPMLRSKSSNSLHNLGPPTRSPLVLTPKISFVEQTTIIPRSNSREKNLNKLRETLRKTLSMTSIEPINKQKSDLLTYITENANRKNSTFLMEPEPPKQCLMNGCFSITPESKSNFNVTPSLSRNSSKNNFSELDKAFLMNMVVQQPVFDLGSSSVSNFNSGRDKLTAFQLGDEDD